jgi:hypothetical protein
MSQIEQYFKNYYDAGFHFSSSVLSTYALSLVTKPFVILSGISGTGKTKIAQLFKVPSAKKEKNIEIIRNTPMLSIKVPNKFGRDNFPQQTLPDLLTVQELNDWSTLAAAFAKRGDGGNFTNPYVLTINDAFGSFNIGFYGQRASSPLVRIRYYKSNRDRTSTDYDARGHLTKNYKIGDVLEFRKLSDKVYEVASVNNVEIRKKHIEFEHESIERQCFISVRSDWTDNNELLGYYNLIEKKYHVPSFLEFVLTASNHPEFPFFVILDEMNLSKVEHYFSDILSCSESRILKKEGVFQEKITLYNGVETLETDSESFENINNKVEIPLNLFITGTVNIDESTYSFSSKVLDRANVIEFNDVDLIAYGSGESNDDNFFKLNEFPDFSRHSVPSKEHYDELDSTIKTYLIDLNSILKKNNLHFGYRIVNEIGLFIKNTKLYIGEDPETLIKALDYQLVQKVFPKLNGEYATLEEPLREVLKYLSEAEDLGKINASSTKFPNTIAKLQRMHSKLSKAGYVSFME